MQDINGDIFIVRNDNELLWIQTDAFNSNMSALDTITAAGLEVSQLDRIPLRRSRYELSEPGWFVAGAEVGGLHGAYWCYQDGRRAAGAVANYLARVPGIS